MTRRWKALIENRINIKANINRFLKSENEHQGVQPQERYASFDYCYNYFQSFRENGRVADLVTSENIQQSCLQLGFYLASWGMLRGSTFLLWKSIKFYEPLLHCIAQVNPAVWSIDADCYTEENIEVLMECEHQLVEALREGGRVSGTLVTKIMLGVFGNVPAFDSLFVQGMGVRWSGAKALRCVGNFYKDNKPIIDSYRIETLDFYSGNKTHRLYPKAKIIDMVGFIEGQN